MSCAMRAWSPVHQTIPPCTQALAVETHCTRLGCPHTLRLAKEHLVSNFVYVNSAQEACRSDCDQPAAEGHVLQVHRS